MTAKSRNSDVADFSGGIFAENNMAQILFRQRITKYSYKAALILIFYAFSIALSFFNSYIFHESRYNFKYPLFMTSVTSSIQLVFAVILLAWLGQLRHTISRLSAKQFFRIILPCALASGLDIGLSNTSLKFVTLSFYTMVKSSGPIFVLLCSFLFRLEKPSVSLISIILLIGVGVLMTVWSDTPFELRGFIIVSLAALMTGFRWTLTQIVISGGKRSAGGEKSASKQHSEEEEAGPLSAVFYLAPIMSALLFMLFCIFESPRGLLASPFFDGFKASITTVSLFLVAGLMTFSLIIAEYKVVQETSVMTLSIAGIVKELLTVSLSVFFYHDKLNAINYVGLGVSIFGIMLYNYYRYMKNQRTQRAAVVFEHRDSDAGTSLFLAVPTSDSYSAFMSTDRGCDVPSAPLAEPSRLAFSVSTTSVLQRTFGRSLSHIIPISKGEGSREAQDLLTESEEIELQEYKSNSLSAAADDAAVPLGG